MRKPLIIAGIVVLITTACRAEVNFLLDVQEDASGNVTFELGLDDELLELVEQAGFSADELLNAVPEDQEVQTRTDGDMTYYYAAQPFTDPDDLLATIGTFEDAGAVFADVDLTVEDGGAMLDATVEAPSATEALEGLGLGLGGFDLGDNFLSSSLIVDLPGSLVESNADEVLADDVLRWDIPITGGTVDVQAVTEAEGSDFPVGIAAAVLGAIVIGAAIVWLARRRRRTSVAAVSDTAVPAAPGGLFDDAGATNRNEGGGD